MTGGIASARRRSGSSAGGASGGRRRSTVVVAIGLYFTDALAVPGIGAAIRVVGANARRARIAGTVERRPGRAGIVRARAAAASRTAGSGSAGRRVDGAIVEQPRAGRADPVVTRDRVAIHVNLVIVRGCRSGKRARRGRSCPSSSKSGRSGNRCWCSHRTRHSDLLRRGTCCARHHRSRTRSRCDSCGGGRCRRSSASDHRPDRRSSPRLRMGCSVHSRTPRKRDRPSRRRPTAKSARRARGSRGRTRFEVKLRRPCRTKHHQSRQAIGPRIFGPFQRAATGSRPRLAFRWIMTDPVSRRFDPRFHGRLSPRF